MDFNLLVLTSFGFSKAGLLLQKSPAWLLNKVGANMQLPYKAHFGGAKFGRGWDQLMYGSLTLLQGNS